MNDFDSNQRLMSFWAHLEALRRMLLSCFFSVLIGVLLAFFCYDSLFNYAVKPLTQLQSSQNGCHIKKLETIVVENNTDKESLYKLNTFQTLYEDNTLSTQKSVTLPPRSQQQISILSENTALYVFSPLEGFLISLKLSLWVGLLISAPFWGYFIMNFLGPALSQFEKKHIYSFLLLSLFFISIGLSVAYFITIPLANAFFLNWNADIGMNFWSVEKYIDYSILLMVANGVAFEILAILFSLISHRIVKHETLIKKRRFVILGAFILGALLTPPDVLTQCLLAIPLCIFYEIAIWYAKTKTSST